MPLGEVRHCGAKLLAFLVAGVPGSWDINMPLGGGKIQPNIGVLARVSLGEKDRALKLLYTQVQHLEELGKVLR